jgi:hypothetical protein
MRAIGRAATFRDGDAKFVVNRLEIQPMRRDINVNRPDCLRATRGRSGFSLSYP